MTLARFQAWMMIVTDIIVMCALIVGSLWFIGMIIDSVYAAITHTTKRFKVANIVAE